jgi:hypothetical protein
MEGVTSALSFTAAVTYAAKLSTTTTDTSVQGLLGGLYFGGGKSAWFGYSLKQSKMLYCYETINHVNHHNLMSSQRRRKHRNIDMEKDCVIPTDMDAREEEFDIDCNHWNCNNVGKRALDSIV